MKGFSEISARNKRNLYKIKKKNGERENMERGFAALYCTSLPVKKCVGEERAPPKQEIENLKWYELQEVRCCVA